MLPCVAFPLFSVSLCFKSLWYLYSLSVNIIVYFFFFAKLDLGLFISFFLVCLFLFLCQSHDRGETAGRQKTKVLTIIATVDFPVMLSSDTVICLTNAIFFPLSLFKTRISDVWACVSSSNFTFLYYLYNLAQYPRLLRSGINLGWNYLLKEIVAVRSVCLSRKHLHIYLLYITDHHIILQPLTATIGRCMRDTD